MAYLHVLNNLANGEEIEINLEYVMAVYPPADDWKIRKNPSEAFYNACRNNDVKLAARILERYGGEVKTRDDFSPLHHAIKLLNYHMIVLLVNNLIDVERTSTFDRTPLHELCNLRMWHHLDKATFNRHCHVTEYLLCAAKGVNALDVVGATPLHHVFSYPMEAVECDTNFECMRSHQLNMSKLLLTWKADATIVRGDGRTILHAVFPMFEVVLNGYLNDRLGAEIVQLLLDNGAPLETLWAGRTPLQMAVKSLNYAIAEVLVQNGAKLPNLLTFERSFPILGSNVVNSDTIIRTYFLCQNMYGKWTRSLISNILTFLERRPTRKSSDGFAALLQYGSKEEIIDYFDDVWLALEDQQLPRQQDRLAWSRLKNPILRSWTVLQLGFFYYNKEMKSLYAYLEEIALTDTQLYVVQGIGHRTQAECAMADTKVLTRDFTLLDICKGNPKIIHEDEVYEAVWKLLNDDFESDFVATHEVIKGHFAKMILSKLHHQLIHVE